MKKILSVLLAAMMVVSCLAVLAVSVGADDMSGAAGEWDVFAGSDDYPEIGDTSGEVNPLWRSIPGKEYTEDGLELVVPDWSDYSPRATFQTKNAVNLRDGVYLQLRIDDFTWEANDKWLQFQLFSDKVDAHDEMTTYSWITFRPDNTGKKITQCYVVTSPAGTATMSSATNIASTIEPRFDDEDNMIIDFEITYNKGTYNFLINGVSVNPDAVASFSEYIEDLDGRMYVGVAAQNNVKNGVVDFTITKYGKNATDASKPVGNDKTGPVNRKNTPAPAGDPDAIAAGQPALWLSASSETSDIAFKLNGTRLLDDSLRMKFDGNQNWFVAYVTNEKTYNVEEFPYAMVMVRNYCTCEWHDIDGDWEVTKLDVECACTETINSGVIIGDIVQAGDVSVKGAMGVSDITKVGEDFYSYFVIDYTEGNNAGNFGGRINGLTINLNGFRSGEGNRNEFDLVGIGYFKTTDDIETFYEAKLADYQAKFEKGESFLPNTDNNDGEEVTTAEEVTTEAEETTVEETTAEETTVAETTAEETTVEETTVEETTVEEVTTVEETTEKATVQETEKQTEEKTEDPDVNVNVNTGCGGVVGVGAVAVIALASAGFVSFRKKND